MSSAAWKQPPGILSRPVVTLTHFIPVPSTSAASCFLLPTASLAFQFRQPGPQPGQFLVQQAGLLSRVLARGVHVQPVSAQVLAPGRGQSLIGLSKCARLLKDEYLAASVDARLAKVKLREALALRE